MDTFQITVLVVAAVLLILIFVTIGILTTYATINTVYPPIANTCPDYWGIDTNGNCMLPGTTHKNRGSIDNLTAEIDANSGTYTPGYISTNGGAINFSDSAWSSLGKTTMCAKKNWATKQNIAWDGVSNYNSCD
jgi:hypothetical protein